MNSKWLIVIGIILLILILLLVLGRKLVHTEITINASSEEVWKVLTDTEKYNEWNPTMQIVSGSLKEGNKVLYKFTQDIGNTYDIPVMVKQIEPNKLLNQTGGYPFILAYNHKYILEPEGKGTKVIIHEDYRGVGVNFWNPKSVEVAYAKLNEALKKRVELLN